MSDNTTTESGMLIGIKMMTGQLATGHMTNRVNEITTVEVFKPILVQVMSVGTAVEVQHRQILLTVLVTSVL